MCDPLMQVEINRNHQILKKKPINKDLIKFLFKSNTKLFSQFSNVNPFESLRKVCYLRNTFK